MAIKNPVSFSRIVSVEPLTADEMRAIQQALCKPGIDTSHHEQEIAHLIAQFRAKRAVMQGPTLRTQQAYARRLRKYYKRTQSLPEPQAVPFMVKAAVVNGAPVGTALQEYEQQVSATRHTPGQPAQPDRDALIRNLYNLFHSTGASRPHAEQKTRDVLVACGIFQQDQDPDSNQDPGGMRRARNRAIKRMKNRK
ncbi:MAG: hypothetical protein WBF84_08935 [Castellaniella sp.]|uniref:ProQ/FINO family protein n=1 Tax=Castellaniella hirudinis TaxID=1144617 RepID=A0ABV8RZD7_9BURK